MRLSGTKTGAINQYNGLGDQLYDLGGARPTLDLNFANNGSLVDSVTGETLVQHTRQSNATYVDGDGVIRNAVTNLLLRSEEFDNSPAWAAVDAYISADATTAPNGTTTADKIVASGGVAEHYVRQEFNALSGATYTFSCYLKASERSVFSLAFRVASLWPSSENQVVDFDLTAETLTVFSGTPTASIINLGNGWYRCSITQTTVASGTAQVRIQSIYDSDGSGIYIWGAQLEQSTTVGEYIPTTSTINSAPRFDHDPTTGESLGLLVEEARTNEVRSSSLTGGATGTPGTYPTGLVTNSLASGLTLQIAALGTDAGVGYIDIRVSGTTADTNGFSISLQPSTDAVASSGQIWTGSCYCSLVAGSYLNTISPRLRILERTAVGGYLAEGSGVAITATGTSILQARATVTRTLANALTARAQLGFVVSIASGVAVDFTFRFAAPQLELGAFPTSYIPTTGAAATRAADVASISGSNFSGWWNNTAGTMRSQWVGAANGVRSFHCEDAGQTSTERFAQRIASNYLQTEVGSNGILATRAASGAGTVTYPAIITSCAAYDDANCVVAFRGDVSATATANGSPEPGEMFIGSYRGTATFANGPIARLTYWPARLPNDTLQTITT
jgi:hypothetical protein